METLKIWNDFSDELYFFILKKVKNKDATNDIFQNTFVKIHENLVKLKEDDKARAWIFQIARNEISNHFNKESLYVAKLNSNEEMPFEMDETICCFDKFINDLPEIYKQVIELIYIKEKKQKEVADELNISLENAKVRIKRAKEILKQQFNACCKYEFDTNGKLIGESNCSACKKQ